ncbi:MAG: hypothetical protein Q8Q85_09245 [Gemmatimonadales bacterium]|nr:hypothetical protein [Gemmatimonadales bacterium]
MSAKVRTQVQLERRQYEHLKRLAYERHKSLSAVLRDLLDEALGAGRQKPALVREVRLALVGTGKDVDGRRDVAREHDDYAYGRRQP